MPTTFSLVQVRVPEIVFPIEKKNYFLSNIQRSSGLTDKFGSIFFCFATYGRAYSEIYFPIYRSHHFFLCNKIGT